MTRLFHFSEDPAIEAFTPRPVRVPSQRAEGLEWLNGPLVWAVDEWHQPMYFFPRDCPRILVWPLPTTSAADRDFWLGDRDVRMIAHVEWRWLDRIQQATVYRYELPAEWFTRLGDGSGWVSKEPVTAIKVDAIDNLLKALREANVELRLMPSLAPLRNAWESSMHVSGIRLRNARDWPA